MSFLSLLEIVSLVTGQSCMDCHWSFVMCPVSCVEVEARSDTVPLCLPVPPFDFLRQLEDPSIFLGSLYGVLVTLWLFGDPRHPFGGGLS